MDLLPFFDKNHSKVIRYAGVLLFFLPLWLLISQIVRLSDIEKIQSQYDENKIKRSANYLAAYVIGNVLLTFVLMFIFT